MKPVGWVAIGGGVILLGGIIYFATRPAASPPVAAVAPGPAPGQPGSRENPLQLPPGQLYGPQGTWATRQANGQAILGSFSQPVTLFGRTQYKFAAVSSTPMEAAPTPAAPASTATYELTLTNDTAIGLKVGETVHFVLPPIPAGAVMWAVVYEAHDGSVNAIGPETIQATSPGVVVVRYTPAGPIGNAIGLPGFNIAATIT